MGWSDAIGEVFKFFNNIFTTPRAQIKKVVNIYDAMHRVLDETPVQRFLIYKAHNGGGIIRPHTPLYMSALYEDYTQPFHTVKHDYQKVELDEEALRVLAELAIVRKIYIHTLDLKASIKKSIYLAEGVQYSQLHYLGQDRKNLYFCSCGTSSKEGWDTDPQDQALVDLCVSKIRNNIK